MKRSSSFFFFLFVKIRNSQEDSCSLSSAHPSLSLPAYPGEDTFMSAMGFIFGIVVTTVAFVVCLMFTGFSHVRDKG